MGIADSVKISYNKTGLVDIFERLRRRSMITGAIRNKIDKIWTDIWAELEEML